MSTHTLIPQIPSSVTLYVGARVCGKGEPPEPCHFNPSCILHPKNLQTPRPKPLAYQVPRAAIQDASYRTGGLSNLTIPKGRPTAVKVCLCGGSVCCLCWICFKWVLGWTLSVISSKQAKQQALHLTSKSSLFTKLTRKCTTSST